jgi:hypothetical protein
MAGKNKDPSCLPHGGQKGERDTMDRTKPPKNKSSVTHFFQLSSIS